MNELEKGKSATKRAEMRCRAEALQDKVRLEEEELDLMKREMQIKHKRELFEMKTEMKIQDAKLAALEEIESSQSEASAKLEHGRLIGVDTTA